MYVCIARPVIKSTLSAFPYLPIRSRSYSFFSSSSSALPGSLWGSQTDR